MALSADLLVERRRLTKSRSFWRIFALLLGALVLIISIIAITGKDWFFNFHGDHVARIEMNGVITGAQHQLELLEKLENDNAVKAVIIAINSPGGTTTGGEVLYDHIRRLAEKKPVVATVDTIGTSAAYIIAIATDRIFVRRNSITGSIGVLFQLPQFTKLMETIGVNVETIKSGSLKAEPSPYSETNEEERAMIRNLIHDSYNWFVDLVAQRRPIDAATIRTQKGRIYTGHQALNLKLVDEIGGGKEALQWLQNEKGLDAAIKIIEHQPKLKVDNIPFTRTMLYTLFGQEIVDTFSSLFDPLHYSLTLDGLVSIWQVHDIKKNGFSIVGNEE